MLKFYFFIAILLILFPVTLPAAEQTVGQGMIIRADQMGYDTTADLVKAEGNVEILWQNTTMTADMATYNRTSQIMTATGNVLIVKGSDSLRGDNLLMDTGTGRAEMENGRIFITKGNFRADGRRIARVGEDDYAIRKGVLTTCDAEVPSWKFGADELDVTVEEYATGTNVLFYVKDIPVFYFPYIILPVNRERQSGLLFPKFGTSSKRGVFMDVPFYWAISPSQDATVNLDIQTTRGVGLGLDYRYLRNRDSDGSLGGYLIYDNTEKKERGRLIQMHKEQFSESFSLITSLNLTSDRTFLTDYGEKSGEYNRQYYDSRIVLTKFWDHWLAGAQAIYTQDYYATSNTGTLQRAPELSLYAVREKIPYIPSLYFDMDLLATEYYREKGMNGQRVVLTPQLSSISSLLGGRMNLAMFGSLQMRGYLTDKTEPGIKDDQLLALPMAGARISSSVSRFYDVSMLGMQKLRHELSPSLSYLYVGDKDQSNVPFFDQLDRENAQQSLTFALASNIWGRLAKEGGSAEYRDLMTLRLLQSYNLNGIRQNLLTLVEDTRSWSDLILESDTWLHRNARLLADIRYSHYDSKISSSALGAEYNDRRGNIGRLSYRMAEDQLDYLEGGLSLAVTSPFYLNYITRYSFDKQNFLESYYSVEYRHQCWSLIAGYRERPNDRSWTVNFNLAGLFNIGTGPSAR